MKPHPLRGSVSQVHTHTHTVFRWLPNKNRDHHVCQSTLVISIKRLASYFFSVGEFSCNMINVFQIWQAIPFRKNRDSWRTHHLSWSFGPLFRPYFFRIPSRTAALFPQDGSWSKQQMRLAQIVRSQTFETIMGVVIVLTLVLLGVDTN